jgi:hypothetical protein
MTPWTPPLALFGLLSATGLGLAADKVVTRFVTEKTDSGTASFVNFAYASCEEECQIATLNCSETGAISVVLADIDAKQAAKAIQQEQKQMVVRVGKKTFDYTITELDYMELTGSWWLTGIKNDLNARELAPAIAAAKVVEVHAGGRKVMLSVDANVKTWAAGCR